MGCLARVETFVRVGGRTFPLKAGNLAGVPLAARIRRANAGIRNWVSRWSLCDYSDAMVIDILVSIVLFIEQCVGILPSIQEVVLFL
jgi:hypothetical protein